jgi:hypothetical protein
MYVPKLTHEERHQRRLRMAAAVAEGELPQTVAANFRVSLPTVCQSCREQGVPVFTKLRGKVSTLRLLAALLNSSSSYAAIARQFHVSRELVRRLAEQAFEAGIRLQLRKREKGPSGTSNPQPRSLRNGR